MIRVVRPPSLIVQIDWADLVYRAKLNKPSNDWKTSEWDRVVEAVADAMKKPPPELPGNAA